MEKASIASQLQVHGGLNGSDANRVAGVIWSSVCKHTKICEKFAKEEEAKKHVSTERVRLTPEERAQETADLLDEKLVSREITAAELRELKDIFNLKAKDQDIAIEMVDYSGVDPETFNVVDVVQEMIRRSNATTDVTS